MVLNLRSSNVGFEAVKDTEGAMENQNQVKIVSGVLNLQVFCPESVKYGSNFLIQNTESGNLDFNQLLDKTLIIFFSNKG